MAIKIGIGLFTCQVPAGSGRSFADEYADTLELVRLVESGGLDGAWVSEHHFSADGYLPSVLVMLGAFAAVTERIELGTGVVLAPFHDPVRLAEDFAVVDQLARGRTVAGIGIGWRAEEFRAFGVPVRTRPGRLEEIVDILRLAWSQDRFSYSGRYYRYDRVSVTPKPARTPPILLGGFADAAVRRAGRIGDGYLSSRAPVERLEETLEMAASERAAHGRPGPPIVGALTNAFVTEDPGGDWAMVAAGIGHQLGLYAGWRAGTDVPGEPLRVMPPDEDALRAATAYGTPDEVVAALAPAARALGRYPDARLVVRLHYPGMPLERAAGAVELFARRVAPALRDEAARP